MKILITFILLLSSIVGGAQTVVDCDYQRYVKLSSLMYDINENGVIEDDEYIDVDGEFTINHKDFDTAGNLMFISFVIKKSDGTNLVFSKRYEDVRFFISRRDNKNIYVVLDKFGENLYGLSQFGDGRYMLILHDLNLIMN